MGGGFAPRFAVEALFLVLLAVGAGFADLRPAVIVALMGGGWLLVSLIEYFAWRASSQAALRAAGTLAQRREPEPHWSVEEILVPESELAGTELEAAQPTTVLPPEQQEDKPEAAPEPAPQAEPRRRRFRRRKQEEAAD